MSAYFQISLLNMLGVCAKQINRLKCVGSGGGVKLGFQS